MLWTEAGVEVVASQRSDGIVARTMLHVSGGRLVGVTNPVGENIQFEYEDAGLLVRVASESGAMTEVSYQKLADARVAVDQVRVVDSRTRAVLSVREWDVVGDHTASGWPMYANQGALWGSGDDEFTYQTQLSDGVTRVVSEYNSQGLMTARRMVVFSGAGDATVQEQYFVFPGTENGGVADPQLLPKHYQRPIMTRAVFRNDRGGTREVSQSMLFDDTGRVTKQVSADGQITETVYDTEVSSGMRLAVGVVLEQTITGVDGSVTKIVNTPTVDRKAIAVTETFTGQSRDALTSTGRRESTVQPNGFVSEERFVATGDSGAPPEMVVLRFTRTVHEDAGTVSVTQTDAAGTSAESTTTVVVDKVTGLPFSTTDPAGRVTTWTYDTAGRVLTETDPAGLQTLTEYGNNVTQVTNPTGVIVSEYVDVLGQVVKVTDNIADTGAHGAAPVAGFERTIETRKYEENSSKVTITDARGLETVTVTDVFGRPVEVTAPNGSRQLSVYDDVANTISTALLAGSGGFEDAVRFSTTVRDDADRVVEETTSRADKIPVPGSRTTYDGLGRVTRSVAGDLLTSVVLNPNGTPKTTTLSPMERTGFTGQPVTAVREHNAFGVSIKKTLTHPDGDSRDGISRVLDAGGRTVAETDQAGNTTWFE
jgi:YD repeat-containing protein